MLDSTTGCPLQNAIPRHGFVPTPHASVRDSSRCRDRLPRRLSRLVERLPPMIRMVFALVFAVAAGALVTRRCLRAHVAPIRAANWRRIPEPVSLALQPVAQSTAANVASLGAVGVKDAAPAEANENLRPAARVDGVSTPSCRQQLRRARPSRDAVLDLSAAISPLSRFCCGRVNRGWRSLAIPVQAARRASDLVARNGRRSGTGCRRSALAIRSPSRRSSQGQVIVVPSGGEYASAGSSRVRRARAPPGLQHPSRGPAAFTAVY